MSFDSGFQARRRRLTSLCVNADPSVELLQSWGLPPGAAGLAAFVDTVLEAVRDTVAVVKPQSAFFEQFGPDGMAELQRLCSRLSQRGILVIADCKRGDVGHSMEAYARTWLGPDQAYAVSAMTLNPYLGFGALWPAIGLAASSGQATFVVVSSSNAEGAAVQTAITPGGQSVAACLAADVAGANARHLGADGAGRTGPCGAVCGLSGQRSPGFLPGLLGNAPILVPGIGAQGGTCADFPEQFAGHLDRAVPAVGRDILRHGPSARHLAEAIGRFQELLAPTRD